MKNMKPKEHKAEAEKIVERWTRTLTAMFGTWNMERILHEIEQQLKQDRLGKGLKNETET